MGGGRILPTKCHYVVLPSEIQTILVKIDNIVKYSEPYDTVISKTGGRKEKSHLLNHPLVQTTLLLICEIAVLWLQSLHVQLK